MTRATVRASLLTNNGWAGAEILPLAGDASARRYFRVKGDNHSAVLMDVADDPTDSLHRFLTIGAHLRAIGLNPPAVLAEDRSSGLLLLEDLGDDLFARVMARNPGAEIRLYREAIDVLGVIQSTPAPDLPAFDAGVMADIAGLAASSYGGRPQETEALVAALHPMLDQIAVDTPVMVLRDYHAENLVWCPNGTGAMRVGVLDFQDAVLGHPVYDLVSLLQDARRDVPLAVETELKAYATSLLHWDSNGFDFAYALLGAQRALRILGVFARLSLEHGKPGYVDLIPRVWHLLERNLSHPDLSALAGTVLRILPEPDSSHLNDLKARCQTLPTP